MHIYLKRDWLSGLFIQAKSQTGSLQTYTLGICWMTQEQCAPSLWVWPFQCTEHLWIYRMCQHAVDVFSTWPAPFQFGCADAFLLPWMPRRAAFACCILWHNHSHLAMLQYQASGSHDHSVSGLPDHFLPVLYWRNFPFLSSKVMHGLLLHILPCSFRHHVDLCGQADISVNQDCK